jgi:hypothetical protein
MVLALFRPSAGRSLADADRALAQIDDDAAAFLGHPVA